ncbi:MAG: hypothetical protein H6637_05440 [Ardenticatenales bacterium]|nr:hypothetical protein [Ardenticatenales bacterium]
MFDVVPDWILQEQRGVVEASMKDRCRVLTPTYTTDAATRERVKGEPSASAETRCSFVPVASSERLSRQFAQLDITAVAYLPLGSVVTHASGFRLTKRNGDEVDPPEEYDVDGEPQVLDTALLLKLKTVSN